MALKAHAGGERHRLDAGVPAPAAVAQVEPGAESAAGAAHHHDADGRIVEQRIEVVAELRRHPRCDGVELLRPVQRQPVDLAALLDQDCLIFHGIAP